MITAAGWEPTLKVGGGERGHVLPQAPVVLRNTETVLSPALATTRSGTPSPFRSPTATEMGRLLPVISVFAEKVTGPPNRTDDAG